jgi:exodeoxyribonuclease VII small subunit
MSQSDQQGETAASGKRGEAAGTGGTGVAGGTGGTGGTGEPGYAEALAELESILHELEGEAVDVDHLAERVRRAAVLIRLCRGRIDTARMEIEQVVAELDSD